MAFQLRKFADIGTSTPWVARAWLQVLAIRQTVFTGFERDAFDEKYAPIFENLMECYNAMEPLHKTITEHEKKVNSQEIFEFQSQNLVVTDSIHGKMNQAAKDFFIKGNIAINHVYPFSKFMGYNISFLRMKDDKEFEQAAAKLVSKVSAAQPLVEMLRRHRGTWLKCFLDLRDRIEHESLPRLAVHYSVEAHRVRAQFPLINNEELVSVTLKFWQKLSEFIEDVAVALLGLRLPPPLRIAIIPEERRDPTMPLKYVVTV
jgi:hypothetical protein